MSKSAFMHCFRKEIWKRSLGVAIVVGTVLTAINQGDVILAGEAPVIWKVVLTYIVPFCVATYGAYGAFVTKEGTQEDGA